MLSICIAKHIHLINANVKGKYDGPDIILNDSRFASDLNTSTV